VRYRVARAIQIMRRGWADKARAAFVLVQRVPARIRAPIARPLANIAERTARRRPTPTITQLAFVARWAAGPQDAAAALARSLATSPEVSAETQRNLASMAISGGLRDVAWEIVDMIPDDRTPRVEIIRAQRALDQGRYREAADHAKAAGTTAGADRLAERADGLVTAFQPGWTPPLDGMERRLRRIRYRARPGRVLHLVYVSLPYRQAGYTVRTQSVATGQRQAGLDAHVATRAGFPGSEGVHRAPKVEIVDGVPYHRVAPDYVTTGRQDETLRKTARATVRLVEELRPAVIQPHSNHLQAQVALALARPAGIPVVYEVRGFWEETWAAGRPTDEDPYAADRFRLSREAETAAILASDAVITLSETMRQEIIERGCPPERITIIPNAVELERFMPLPRDDALGASLGIEAGESVVGYVSSLSAYEGIPYLLEAAAKLRESGCRLRVLLVGDGEDRRAIEEAATRLGLDDGTLIMTGRVAHDDVPRYYSLIDVFVVPRTGDRVSRLVTPIKPYEAMALERPVVVSDLPALREIVVPGETGMTFRAEDADDLARTLGVLLEDPALRQRLATQAREWIRAERTWEHNGRRYRELFERLGVA
jgi:glycosyltransferase involved in cell wall biosynthesis